MHQHASLAQVPIHTLVNENIGSDPGRGPHMVWLTESVTVCWTCPNLGITLYRINIEHNAYQLAF